jgi:hypothetical protein
MSTLIEVDKKNILRKVMSIVSQAHNEVLATMDIDEEIRNPLQEEYFFLLKKMVGKGVIMKRLAFGGKINFKKFNNEHNIKNKNYHCVLARTQNYKRMILVDRKNLFFATGTEEERRFFFTKDAKYIKEFARYFSTEFKK